MKFKQMKKTLLITFSLSILFTCKAQTNEAVQANETKQVQVIETIQLVDVAAFKKGIANQNVQLIDVRTPKEYEEGHIENSTLINYFSENFKTKLSELNKNKPLYLYCRSGVRSGKASKVLSELGFKEIYDLEGGYLAWKSQN